MGYLSSSPVGRLRAFEAVVLLALLLLFLNFAEWNYRSHDGFLGSTVPAWQTEILAGTAPAPYVYRQGVPQLRRLAGLALQPGHAAVLVDLFFAALAVGCGLALGRYALGAAQCWTGAFAALLATVTVYPNDKPESVATVGLTLLVIVLALEEHDQLAATVCAAAAPFRPELPILFGASFLLATLRLSETTRTRGAFAGYAMAAVIGASYLVASRFLLWPYARYPLGTPALMLTENLTHVGRYPGLLLLASAASVGAGWCARAWPRPGRWVAGADALGDRERKAMLGVGLFVVLWSLAQGALGKADEIRLVMPVLPACALLGLRRWRPWPAWLADARAATQR